MGHTFGAVSFPSLDEPVQLVPLQAEQCQERIPRAKACAEVCPAVTLEGNLYTAVVAFVPEHLYRMPGTGECGGKF